MTTLVDKNLFYNVKRANRIGPQLQGNYISFDLQAKMQVPRVTPRGPGDQNLFYRVKARRTPNFQKRIISDLDPLTRIIGQIPRTAGQKRAAGVLSALETISGVLSKFLSTPELNPDGTQKTDAQTGLPIVKLRNISDMLAVSHQAVIQAFTVAGVKISQNIKILVESLTTDEVNAVIARLQSVERVNPSQEARDNLYPDVIIKQILKNTEEQKIEPNIENALIGAINEQNIHVDPVKEFGRVFITPEQWKEWSPRSDERGNVLQFIKKRLILLKRTDVLSITGVPVPILQAQFTKGHFLDLNELRFKKKKNVPKNER